MYAKLSAFIIGFAAMINGQYLSAKCHKTSECSYWTKSECTYIVSDHFASFSHEMCNFVHDGQLVAWMFETDTKVRNGKTTYFDDVKFANEHVDRCTNVISSGRYNLLNSWLIVNVSTTTVNNSESQQCMLYEIGVDLYKEQKPMKPWWSSPKNVVEARNIVYSKCQGDRLRPNSSWTVLYTENDLSRLLKFRQGAPNEPFAFYATFHGNGSLFGIAFASINEATKHRHDIYQICTAPAIDTYCSNINKDTRQCSQCVGNFTGAQCHLEDICRGHICFNNGTVVTVGDHCECACAPGYENEHCAGVVDYCRHRPCGRNGFCVNQPPSYKCNCHDGYYGTHCERHKPRLAKFKIFIILITVMTIVTVLLVLWADRNPKTKTMRAGRFVFEYEVRRDNLWKSFKSFVASRLAKIKRRPRDLSVTVTDSSTNSD